MKNYLKLLLSLAGFALAAATAAHADDTTAPAVPPTPPTDQPGGRHGRGEMRERLQTMVKDLNLTPDQQSKIGAILKQSAQSMKALRGDTTLSQDDKRAKLMELRRSSEEQINALLTPDQQAKAKELRQQRRAQQGATPPPPPPPANNPPTT